MMEIQKTQNNITGPLSEIMQRCSHNQPGTMPAQKDLYIDQCQVTCSEQLQHSSNKPNINVHIRQ